MAPVGGETARREWTKGKFGVLPVSGDGGGLTGYDGGMNAAELSGLLTALVRAHPVSGAQFTLRHRGDTVAVVAGEAEYRAGPLVTTDLAFPIGSIGKAFTATVVMILVAEGDLELDEPVGGHVPELTGLPTAAVPPRQLLVAELGRRGLSIPSGSLTTVPEIEFSAPVSCFGIYRNGDTEYSTTPDMVLSVDDEPQVMIMFCHGLTFSFQDIQSGLRMYAGRCLSIRKPDALTGSG